MGLALLERCVTEKRYVGLSADIQGYSKLLSGFQQTVIHNTLEIAVYVFFNLIKLHSSFRYIPYRCSICAPFVILQTTTR
jgi:hypothetical protein